jgi:hypothetical protein
MSEGQAKTTAAGPRWKAEAEWACGYRSDDWKGLADFVYTKWRWKSGFCGSMVKAKAVLRRKLIPR